MGLYLTGTSSGNFLFYLIFSFNSFLFLNFKEIAICLSASKLSNILYCLAKNFRHFRKGLPDLLIWNAQKKTIKMVEVKGPKDKLSYIQKIWLNKLHSIGVDVELCNVEPDSQGKNLL